MRRIRQTSLPRWAGLVVGIALLAAAVGLALKRVSLDDLSQTQPWTLAMIAAGVIGNLLLTGVLFWTITRPFAARPPVDLLRMIQLITASHLLNYLPLQAGLIGRAAYLKDRHGLPLRQSAAVQVIVMALGAAVAGAAVAAAVWNPSRWPILVLLVLAVLFGPACTAILRRPMTGSYAWVPLRLADLAVTGLRLWAAFQAIGHPVDVSVAFSAGAVGAVVAMTGLTPNGLGLREWAVALTASLLHPEALAAAGLAAVIDRGVEALVVTPMGLWSIRRLTHVKSA